MKLSSLKPLLSSGYVRAVATLSTGQFIAAFIPMLAAPILGRLYLPAEYGILATYMAVANVLGVMSTFQLQHAIIAEKNDARAYQMVRLCQLSSVLVAVFATFVAGFIFLSMSDSASFQDARHWMLLLPLTVIIGGTTTSLNFLANRQKRYPFMARAQVIMVCVSVALSLSLGFLGWGVAGLFTAYFTSQIVYCLIYLNAQKRMRPDTPPSTALVQSRALLKRHKRYAFYTMPSSIMETLNMQMPILILSSFGTASLIGAFSRARQLVGAPMTLLGASISQVFRQRGAELYNQTGSCRELFRKTFITLTLVGLLPILTLILFGPELFMLFLGPNWGQAGEIARILAPMFLLRLSVSPLTQVFYFTYAQDLDFWLSIASFILVLCGVLIPTFLKLPDLYMIIGYATAYCIIYITYGFFAWARTVK